MQSQTYSKAVGAPVGLKRSERWGKRAKRKAERLTLGKSGQIQLGDDGGWAGRVAVKSRWIQKTDSRTTL